MVTINKQSKSTFFFLYQYFYQLIHSDQPSRTTCLEGWKISLSLLRKTTAGKNQLELCINRRLLHIRFEVGRSSSPLLPFLHSLFYQFIFLSNSTLVSCNINYDFVRKYNFCARIYAAIGHDAVTARI